MSMIYYICIPIPSENYEDAAKWRDHMEKRFHDVKIIAVEDDE